MPHVSLRGWKGRVPCARRKRILGEDAAAVVVEDTYQGPPLRRELRDVHDPERQLEKVSKEGSVLLILIQMKGI